jgi:hypothetical protein
MGLHLAVHSMGGRVLFNSLPHLEAILGPQVRRLGGWRLGGWAVGGGAKGCLEAWRA